jgi:uncharacterized repeat protein (TIGR03803 family)
VVFDKAGNMYGTTCLGGTYNDGTVFEMSPKGSNWTESVLFSFDDTDGFSPSTALVMDASGNLYGTATYGGANNNGVVFELSPGEDGQWTETTLHTFDFSTGDGNWPNATLIFDAKGNLYGTTTGGGTGTGSCGFEGCGTVFEIVAAIRRQLDGNHPPQLLPQWHGWIQPRGGRAGVRFQRQSL